MLTFPAFADLSLWLHPSAMRLFFSGHCKLWGAYLLSVNPWLDLPLLETQPPSPPPPHEALKAQVSHSGFGTPLDWERPAAVPGHTATGTRPGASLLPTWKGSCAFKAFLHPRPTLGGRGGAGSQLGSGDLVLCWSAAGGPALEPGELGWNRLWLYPNAV